MPYRPTHRTAHRNSTNRAAFLRAALILFSERGYHATSIRSIIAAAHSSNGSFYFYFRNKEHLFVSALESSAKGMARALHAQLSAPRLSPSPFQQIRYAVETLVLLLVRNSVVARFLIAQSSAPGALLETLRRDVLAGHAQFFEQLLATLDPPPADCAFTARCCVGAIHECVHHWLELPADQRPTPQPLAATVAGFTLHGILRGAPHGIAGLQSPCAPPIV